MAYGNRYHALLGARWETVGRASPHEKAPAGQPVDAADGMRKPNPRILGNLGDRSAAARELSQHQARHAGRNLASPTFCSARVFAALLIMMRDGRCRGWQSISLPHTAPKSRVDAEAPSFLMVVRSGFTMRGRVWRKERLAAGYWASEQAGPWERGGAPVTTVVTSQRPRQRIGRSSVHLTIAAEVTAAQ
jgi:hypothetical protein